MGDAIHPSASIPGAAFQYLEGSPDPFLLVDEKGRIQWANARLCAQTGNDRDSLLGWPLDSLLKSPLNAWPCNGEVVALLCAGDESWLARLTMCPQESDKGLQYALSLIHI